MVSLHVLEGSGFRVWGFGEMKAGKLLHHWWLRRGYNVYGLGCKGFGFR